jgi:hypothetical protein
MASNTKTLIIVIGMHRSGTSAITRGLRAVGANLGDHLLAPQDDNPKGFWEDIDFHDLHVEIFDAIGMEWNRLSPVNPREIDALRQKGFLQKAKDILDSKLVGKGVFALKYPRVPKIFPFWREVFSSGCYDVRYLIPVRHPLSIARSLSRRDGIDKEYACLMWLAHVLPVFPLPNAADAIVTDYDRLMEEPAREIGRLASRFRLHVDAGEMADYCNNFLSPQLRHTSHTLADLESDPGLHPLIAEVYRELLEFATDRRELDDDESIRMFNRWNDVFASMTPLLRLIEQTTMERDRQAILLDNAVSELKWKSSSLSWKITQPLRSALSMMKKVTGG